MQLSLFLSTLLPVPREVILDMELRLLPLVILSDILHLCVSQVYKRLSQFYKYDNRIRRRKSSKHKLKNTQLRSKIRRVLNLVSRLRVTQSCFLHINIPPEHSQVVIFLAIKYQISFADICKGHHKCAPSKFDKSWLWWKELCQSIKNSSKFCNIIIQLLLGVWRNIIFIYSSGVQGFQASTFMFHFITEIQMNSPTSGHISKLEMFAAGDMSGSWVCIRWSYWLVKVYLNI